MVFTTREASLHDGQPIEIYKWEGTFNNYFHTSAQQDITIGPDTYVATGISRKALKVTTQNDDRGDMEITLPYDDPLVVAYAFGIPPPNLTLTITSWHEGDDPSTESAVLFKGEVSNFAVTGREAKIRVPSIFSRALRAEIPNRYYHAPCNNTLYDGTCKVVRASFQTTTTVSAIDSSTGVITVASDGAADSFLKAGEMVNTRNNERRAIIDNVSDDITVNIAFTDLIVGDTVELSAGCDRLFTTCKTKFSNAANFTGFPYIPFENLFEGEI